MHQMCGQLLKKISCEGFCASRRCLISIPADEPLSSVCGALVKTGLKTGAVVLDTPTDAVVFLTYSFCMLVMRECVGQVLLCGMLALVCDVVGTKTAHHMLPKYAERSVRHKRV